MKIYVKKGATNYKEKKLIAEIENALNKKSKTDSNILNSFQPATNWDELKSLHDKICGDFVDYEEVKEETDIEKQHKNFRDGMAETVKPNNEEATTFIDPFNDAEPIVRDYVLSEDFESKNENTEPTKTTFDEPTSFEESFELPSEDDEKSTSKTQPKEKASKDSKQSSEKVNPRFDDMSSAKKRRSTKKLAQMIVQGACILAEKGCIWWTTKDITEDKLIQYEIENTMDLQILLTLDEGQQITVREWFGAKVVQANTLFKVSEEDKADLIDSLFEVLLEKGIAPTPMQELMINAVKTFVLDMGLKAFAMRMEIKSVLNQLVSMKTQGGTQVATESQVENITYDDIDDTIINNPMVENGLEIINPINEISETEV